MDFQVIVDNFSFLILQGFVGFGPFAGGTLRLALPAIVIGFVLGTLIGLARLARSPWISLPAKIYVEFFRGVPLVMVIFWFWFIIPALLGRSLPEYTVALTAFVIFEAAYQRKSYAPEFSPCRAVNSKPRQQPVFRPRR
jgi:His/Glu/Gln/Arg/opine family amino acid ABC transporter permease subunit